MVNLCQLSWAQISWQGFVSGCAGRCFLEEMGLWSKKDLYSLMWGSSIQHAEVLMERKMQGKNDFAFSSGA